MNINKQKLIKELMYIKRTLVDAKDSKWCRYMRLNYGGTKESGDKKVLPSILEYANVIKR